MNKTGGAMNEYPCVNCVEVQASSIIILVYRGGFYSKNLNSLDT